MSERDERMVTRGPKGDQGEQGKRGDPGMGRPLRRAIAYLVIVGFVLTAVNLLFTAIYVSRDDHKWCHAMTLLTQHQVPRPADPARNPSRVQEYQLNQTFITLKHSLGCGLGRNPS